MKVAQVENISDERDRKFRVTNLIIHGVKDDDNSKDNEWFQKFKEDVGVNLTAKFIGRIGKPNALKRRPLKIVLKSVEGKRSVFSNLNKLKGKSEYTGVSVSEDFTSAERCVIKSWVKKAKEKTEKEGYESNVCYKMRGSPKNGTMRLKKFLAEHSQ